MPRSKLFVYVSSLLGALLFAGCLIEDAPPHAFEHGQATRIALHNFHEWDCWVPRDHETDLVFSRVEEEYDSDDIWLVRVTFHDRRAIAFSPYGATFRVHEQNRLVEFWDGDVDCQRS